MKSMRIILATGLLCAGSLWPCAHAQLTWNPGDWKNNRGTGTVSGTERIITPTLPDATKNPNLYRGDIEKTTATTFAEGISTGTNQYLFIKGKTSSGSFSANDMKVGARFTVDGKKYGRQNYVKTGTYQSTDGYTVWYWNLTAMSGDWTYYDTENQKWVTTTSETSTTTAEVQQLWTDNIGTAGFTLDYISLVLIVNVDEAPTFTIVEVGTQNTEADVQRQAAGPYVFRAIDWTKTTSGHVEVTAEGAIHSTSYSSSDDSNDARNRADLKCTTPFKFTTDKPYVVIKGTNLHQYKYVNTIKTDIKFKTFKQDGTTNLVGNDGVSTYYWGEGDTEGILIFSIGDKASSTYCTPEPQTLAIDLIEIVMRTSDINVGYTVTDIDFCSFSDLIEKYPALKGKLRVDSPTTFKLTGSTSNYTLTTSTTAATWSLSQLQTFDKFLGSSPAITSIDMNVQNYDADVTTNPFTRLNPSALIYVASDKVASAASLPNVVDRSTHQCASLTLSDQGTFAPTAEITVPTNGISYTRTLADATKLNTICLPYAVQVSGFQAKTFRTDMGETNSVRFADVAEGAVIPAHTPFLVSADAEIDFKNQADATIDPSVLSTKHEQTGTQYTYAGRYEAWTVGADETVYVSNGTEFVRAASGLQIPPYRAVLIPNPGSPAAPGRVSIVTDGPTTTDGPTAASSVRIYGAEGCLVVETTEPLTLRVAAIDGRIAACTTLEAGITRLPLAPGLYVANGQKAAVR